MRRLTALAGGLVVLAAVSAHAPGLRGGFVYDDHRFVERNDAIASLARPWRFLTDPATASAAQGIEPDVWRPLRTLHFAVDRALFGLDPFGWHLASIALHAAVAVLVWVLLLRLLARGPEAALLAPDRRGASALAAATWGAILFAVHPVTVESVAWVSSRGDLLAWGLVLLAFEVLHRDGFARTLVGTGLVGLACLAKESAVVAFALLPLRDLALPRERRPGWRTTLLRAAALAGVTAVYLAARHAVLPGRPDLPVFAQTDFPGGPDGEGGGRAAAARGALASAAWYARVLLLPLGFPFDRNVHTDPVPLSFADPAVVVGAGVLLTVLLASVAAWRSGRRVQGFGGLGLLVALAPVSNVVVPLKAFAAERFLYPALPCLAAALAAGGLGLAGRVGPAGRRRLAAAACGVVLALGVLAARRTVAWRDDASLWAAVRAEEPMNPRAYEGLAFEHLRAGRYVEAERALATYREFQPFDGKARAQTAALLRGVYEERRARAPDPAADEFDRPDLPRFLLAQAILESRAALEIWSRVGLERGRGDPVLRRATIEGWREAALEYGDLAEARRANRLLLEEDEARGGPADYAQRRMVPLLAALALSVPRTPDADREARRLRARADLLADAGVEPSLPDARARDALVTRLDALLAERPGDHALRRHRVQFLLARVEGQPPAARAQDLERLEEDLAVLTRAFPDEGGLQGALRAVRARRGGR